MPAVQLDLFSDISPTVPKVVPFTIEMCAVLDARSLQESIRSDGHDELLMIGDKFKVGSQIYRLVNFKVNPSILDGQIVLDTVYCFKGNGSKQEIQADDLLTEVNTGAWIPISPADCVYIVNSLIYGTSEFDEELRLTTGMP